MEQRTFADLEYEAKKRVTRREKFLARMERLIPWEQLEARIRPFYPKAGRGRRPYPLSTMLRIHCVQLFYNLSDPGMEDLLYEVESVRRFVGLEVDGAAAGRDDDSEVPSPAGGARSGGDAVPGDGSAPGAARTATEPGDDRGREHPGGAFVDQEPKAGARPGDASDEGISG